MHGGDIIGEVLARRGVNAVFTLCGGHISPILTGAKQRGVRIVDLRNEADAVFAADAAARLSGNIGVAAVTAGPGVTNSVTAIKNAQMAESPVLLFGGATATILRGRGSLQDIDQMSVMESITKWTTRITTVPALAPTVERAIDVAMSGTPGPVFLEVPIDLLYPESIVREWYLKEAQMSGIVGDALRLYMKGHLYRQFHQPHLPFEMPDWHLPTPDVRQQIAKIARSVREAKRPVLVVGSQTLVNSPHPQRIADAVRTLGIPAFLGGMARGLLGRDSPTQFRHERGKALKEADVVIIAGFPFDFRLKYGQGISRKAELIAVNLNQTALRKNRLPEIAVRMHPGELLVELAERVQAQPHWGEWLETLRGRESARDREIEGRSGPEGDRVNPLYFFQRLEQKLADESVLIADGGDFVATGSYILKPRSPLSWLDPGVYGTLGVGGGFAVGAAVCRPGAETWILYGDGSCAYSIAEFDTFVRHGLAPIAVIGTDASWAQIARDQIEILGDDVGTTLRDTDYHDVARGYGGVGLLVKDAASVDGTLDEAKRIAKSGKPVCVNVLLAKTDFRKGSISV